MLEFYVEVVDEDGLRYRSLAECVALTEDEAYDEQRIEDRMIFVHAEPIVIFDEKDNVIYEHDTSLFP